MIIWSYWPDREGGAERQCRNLTRWLAEKGVECEVLTSWSSIVLPRRQKDGRCDIRRIGFLCPLTAVVDGLCGAICRKIAGFRAVHGVHGAQAVAGNEKTAKAVQFWLMLPFVWMGRFSFLLGAGWHVLLRGRAIDVIHVHEASWLAGLAAWVGNKRAVPVVCKEATYPCMSSAGFDVPFRRLWENWRTRASFVAMGAHIADALKKKGIAEQDIFMVPNGVEIPARQADTALNAEALYVGNFSQGSQWKAFDVLFDAWIRTQQEMPDMRLTVVGSGDHSQWQSLLEQAGCASSVTFAGPAPDVAPYYEKAAFLVLPSRVEGMSNVLLESQSWGLPAVVSDIPGNTAVIEDGVNGLVVPVGDAIRLKTAMINLHRDSDLRKKMGRAARTMTEKRFSRSLVTDTLIGVYTRLCARATE